MFEIAITWFFLSMDKSWILKDMDTLEYEIGDEFFFDIC